MQCRQGNGQHPGVLVNLHPAGLPFFGKGFEGRKDHLQKLKNDGGVDIGVKAESHDGKIRQGAAGKNVQQAEELVLIKELF